MEPILIYDTTLRDGTQGENVTFTADEKLKIAIRLDEWASITSRGDGPVPIPGTFAFLIWPNVKSSRRPGSPPSDLPVSPALRPRRPQPESDHKQRHTDGGNIR
jgi:hypothetical protein